MNKFKIMDIESYFYYNTSIIKQDNNTSISKLKPKYEQKCLFEI